MDLKPGPFPFPWCSEMTSVRWVSAKHNLAAWRPCLTA